MAPVLMVILGAGASKDSVHPENESYKYIVRQDAPTPTTTDELFTSQLARSILNEFAAARGLAERVRFALRSGSAGTTSLEGEVRKALDEAGTDPTRLRELAAFKLFLQRLVTLWSEAWVLENGGLTNQVWLVREIEFWRVRAAAHVVYVTFNYDTILDQALWGQYGWDPRDSEALDGFISDARFVLLKLHGSYDWMRGTDLTVDRRHPASIRAQLVRAAGKYTETNEFLMLARAGPAEVWPHTYRANLESITDDPIRAWTPAISLPVMNKSDFACPDAHIRMLEDAIPKVSRVLAIGWRAQEYHFLQKLQHLLPSAPITVVSPGNPAATVGRLKSALKVSRDIKDLKLSFSEFRDAGRLADLLE